MLTRWDPFSEINRLRGTLLDEPRRGFTPAIDILEEDDGIVMKAEVPGMSAEDIHVHVENNVLTLTGERSFEREESEDRYHRVERSFGKFTRAFVLPKNVDGESIQASLGEGVLTLKLPKRAVSEKRRIEIS